MPVTAAREPGRSRPPQVLIVGAGPTGLVLALWLTRRGIPVRIIDKTAGPGTTSRALAVQARTLEFYRQLGFADAVVAGGVKIASVNLWARGTRAAQIPLGAIGQGMSAFPFALVFPQDAHEALLVEQLRALHVTVERQTGLLRFEQHPDRVTATLVHADGTTEAVDAAWLAGCDGARSTVREGLGIGFEGGTYTHLFYVADVDASGPATDNQLHVALDDADFLIVFPLRGTGRVRLVGAIRDDPARGTRDLTFDDVSGKVIAQLQLKIARVNWFSTYRVHHRVADRFRHERVFLLGDAAHIHSPVGGQGMNTGIGDAVNLAWKLAAVADGSAGAGVLDSYEPERIAFARRLVATTDRAFTVVTRTGRVARFARVRLFPRIASLVLGIPAFRRFAFRAVSQIAVEYRHSPLSNGQAGARHGGDRLPWIPLDRDTDNFAPLQSLDWQVHVYGHATQAMVAACAELGLALHQFAWTAPMRPAGLVEGACYLLRPDGYIALAERSGDPAALRRYCAAQGVRGEGVSSSP